ncbi:MAG: PspC domain-containing protein [Spirochaetales bacterium]|nr:PspC domain-containing protein [Spirochaetales bacterium]
MEKGRLYRSPNGKVMGVCQGIANWLRMDVSLVRLGVIIVSFMTGGVVLFVYFALGIFLPIDDDYSSESIFDKVKDETSSRRRSRPNSYRRGFTVDDVKNEFDNLKSRVSNMENTVFNKERDWDERFKKSDS